MQKRYLYWDLYSQVGMYVHTTLRNYGTLVVMLVPVCVLQFNTSVNDAMEANYYGRPECTGTLLTMFDSRASVLEPGTIDFNDCDSPCMPLLNRSFSEVNDGFRPVSTLECDWRYPDNDS